MILIVESPGVKQEHSLLEASLLDALELAMPPPPPPPPTPATKRPFEGEPTAHDDQSKRIKTESEHRPQENGFHDDHSAEDSLEDGLAMLVQNALSNVDSLVSQFNQESEIPHTTTDAMEIDSTPVHEAPLPLPPVTFASDPAKFLRNATRYALGNIVGQRAIVENSRSRFIRPFLSSSRSRSNRLTIS